MNAEQHVRPDRLGTFWFKLVTGLTSLRFSLSAGPLPVVTENAKRNGWRKRGETDEEES
jgi:hypothetical protein